jgi:leader peptidase (prepilin peptidase)/N-methyltransferase
MNWIGKEAAFAACLLVAWLTGYICDRVLQSRLKLGKPPRTALLNTLAAAAFLYLYGFSWHTLSCCLLTQLLLFAAVYDLKTHTVPDEIHILILLVGLIELQPLPALLGLLLAPLPLLIAALSKPDSIGGGDVKLVGACGFMLGVSRSYYALTLGLLAAVLCNALFNKKKRPFALIPYLALGCWIILL